MKILIVEDEEKLALAIKKGLATQKMSSDVVFDGEAGLDLAVSEKYDAILLDIMLPKMDGLQVCKQIRSKGVTTPVLMLTAKGEIEDKVEGLDIGADDYLVKPFAFSELVSRIKALTRRPANLLGNTQVVSDLEVDLNLSQVKRGGKIINLSKKEFELLIFLMKNPGVVFSKDQIVASVWEFESDILPETVEVYIRMLRKKIDEPFEKKLIQTVRGFGYKIEANV